LNVKRGTPAAVHEHFDLELGSGQALRFRDPRRFGSLHWADDPAQHWLIRNLGPEPLGSEFDGDWLWRKSRGRRVAVKQFIMNAAIVVGVGNIYASESLFLARINPATARFDQAEYRPGQGGFAGSGLPYDAQGFPGVQLEIDPVHRPELALFTLQKTTGEAGESDGEILDPENGLGHSAVSPFESLMSSPPSPYPTYDLGLPSRLLRACGSL